MKQYHDLLKDIMDNGIDKSDRTGTGTRSVFGRQMRFNLQEGFPLVTTKKVHLKSIIFELLWFLKGDTNTKYLNDHGVTIWDEWADENGDLGPVYGKQWRSWAYPLPLSMAPESPDDVDMTILCAASAGEPYVGTLDQIANVIHQIKKTPDSRRMIVSAWNPAEIEDMKLPPCHLLFQFYTRPIKFIDRAIMYEKMTGLTISEDNQTNEWLTQMRIPSRYLDCQLYQRSADMFLGVPFNIASYALLTMMIAQVTGCIAGEFVHTIGDAHIYHNHFIHVQEQLRREPRKLPTMNINPSVKSIDDFCYMDFGLSGYDPHPAIKAPVAV